MAKDRADSGLNGAQEQVAADRETLRQIVAGLDRLEQVWSNAQHLFQARKRGYFTPDEDDAVRQMLLSYRNYRIVLYQIIRRCLGYAAIQDARLQLEMFMTGFAAGLTLYSRSLKLIQAYERQPLVRQKLNEPEDKFGLEAGFFEEVLAAYSSPRNYWLLVRGVVYWQAHRRLARRLGVLQDDDGEWLAGLIRHQRRLIRKRLLSVLLCRCRYDFRLFLDTTLGPVRRSGYALKRTLGRTFATKYLCQDYRPAITPEVLAELQPQLQPGDILLSRADEKLTAAVLPGFWSHAAIYLGTKGEVESSPLAGHPALARELAGLPDGGGGLVLEAVSPRCMVNPLEKSLYADHVAVLRPNLNRGLLEAGLLEACSHLGKPYDFEFDFNITHRIVCTEVVYRAYHGKGPISFELVKRLGRFTLSGNDLVQAVVDRLRGERAGTAPFQPVALFTKTVTGAHFILKEQLVPALEAILRGEPVAGYSMTPPPRQYSPA